MSEKILRQRRFVAETQEGDILVAKAELTDLGQGPYFSVTGELYQDKPVYGETYHPGLGWMVSCGMLHDDIREHLPALAPYLKWHLFNVHRGPMHYIANALYHLKNGDVDAFKETAVIGTVPGDDEWDDHREDMAQWLEGRLSYLIDTFDDEVTNGLFYGPDDPLPKGKKNVWDKIDGTVSWSRTDKDGTNRWLATITYGSRSEEFSYFTGSGIKEKPTAQEVFAAVMDDYKTFRNVCQGARDPAAALMDEFGYEEKAEAKKLYRGLEDNAEKLEALLGSDLDKFME